jgi:hypothetical protein
VRATAASKDTAASEDAASEDSRGAREEAVELPAALPSLARGWSSSHLGARRHLR